MSHHHHHHHGHHIPHGYPMGYAGPPVIYPPVQPVPYPMHHGHHGHHVPVAYPVGVVPVGVQPNWARFDCHKCRGTGYKLKNGKLCKKCYHHSMHHRYY